jgi:SAM-dependent methyltransferase
MPSWYEDDSFWIENFELMFPEALFNRAENEVDDLIKIAGVTGGRCLDLCCGVGRHSIAFAKKGFITTGVDRVAFHVQRAKARASQEGVDIEFVAMDVRNYTQAANFDLIVNLYTSFGYCETQEENLSVLKNVFSSLKPGGIFLIDVLGKELIALKNKFEECDITPVKSLSIKRNITGDWSKIVNYWLIHHSSEVKLYEWSHFIYSAVELKQMLRDIGFEKLSAFGSYSGKPYDLNAERLVIRAEKPQ